MMRYDAAVWSRLDDTHSYDTKCNHQVIILSIAQAHTVEVYSAQSKLEQCFVGSHLKQNAQQQPGKGQWDFRRLRRNIPKQQRLTCVHSGL